MLMVVFAYLHITELVQAGYSINGLLTFKSSLPFFASFSSFSEREAVLYTTFIFAGLLPLAVSIMEKLIREDRKSKMLSAADKSANSWTSSPALARLVLCGWDNTHTSRQASRAASSSLSTALTLKLDETRRMGVIKSRSLWTTTVLFLHRGVVAMIYAAVQVGAFALILYLTFYADSLTHSLSDTAPTLRILATYMPILGLNAIGQIMPTISKAATKLEGWDSGDIELNVLLLRLFVSYFISALLLAFTYFMLANPFLLAQYPRLRSIEPSVSTGRCRIDQAGENLFSLVILTLLSNQVSYFFPPIFHYLKSVAFKLPMDKPEFDVASQFVSTMAFVALIFVSFPFVPLTMIIVPLYLFMDLKVQLWVTRRLYKKPSRPWQAEKAGVVFTAVYLANWMLVGVPSAVYFISSRTFPKNCDIQDDSVGLCSGDIDADTHVCSDINSNSPFFSTYGLSVDYPATFCVSSCGPFVSELSGLSAFKRTIFKVEFIRGLWTAVLDYPYILGFLLVMLCIALAQRNNTLLVQRSVSMSRERELEAHVLGLQAKITLQAKKLNKFKAVQGTTE